MALIRFTHIGKASVAVNPDLVFSIESYNEGQVGAYTRIRSAGDSHIDVKEPFAVVMERLGEAKPTVAKPATQCEWISGKPSDSHLEESSDSYPVD